MRPGRLRSPSVMTGTVLALAVATGLVLAVAWLRAPAALPVGPGRRAPDFELRYAQSSSRGRLSQLQGTPLLLVFFDTREERALEHLWRLEGVHRRYRDRGLRVVGVGLDDDPARLHTFLTQSTATFTFFSDPGGAVTGPLYGRRPHPRPVAYLLRRDGRVEQALLDPTAQTAKLTDAVDDLLRKEGAPSSAPS